jgi:hypothetical protein
MLHLTTFFLFSIVVYVNGQIVDVYDYSCTSNSTDTITNSCSYLHIKAVCTGFDTASVTSYAFDYDCIHSEFVLDSMTLTAGTCVKADFWFYYSTVYLQLRPGTCNSLPAGAIVGIVFAVIFVTCISVVLIPFFMASCCGIVVCSCCKQFSKNRSNIQTRVITTNNVPNSQPMNFQTYSPQPQIYVQSYPVPNQYATGQTYPIGQPNQQQFQQQVYYTQNQPIQLPPSQLEPSHLAGGHVPTKQ